jgi:hypothetical protein
MFQGVSVCDQHTPLLRTSPQSGTLHYTHRFHDSHVWCSLLYVGLGGVVGLVGLVGLVVLVVLVGLVALVVLVGQIGLVVLVGVVHRLDLENLVCRMEVCI